MSDQNYCETFKLEKLKMCNQCDIRKVLSEFDKGRKKCKECRKIYNAQAYQLNKEKLSAYHAKRYQMQKDLKSI